MTVLVTAPVYSGSLEMTYMPMGQRYVTQDEDGWVT